MAEQNGDPGNGLEVVFVGPAMVELQREPLHVPLHCAIPPSPSGKRLSRACINSLKCGRSIRVPGFSSARTWKDLLPLG